MTDEETIRRKAEKLASKGKMDEAIKLCSDWCQFYLAAQYLEKAGRYREAAERYEQARAPLEAVRCFLACGLEEQALRVTDAEASGVWRNHIENLEKDGKRGDAFQCMLRVWPLSQDDWDALMSEFEGRASGGEQLKLWAQVLVEDRRRQNPNDFGRGQPNWREALAFFLAGDETTAYRIFKKNIIELADDGAGRARRRDLRNCLNQVLDAAPFASFMHWLVRQYVAEGESPNPGVLISLACFFDVDAKGTRLWTTLPAELQRRIIRLLCQSWGHWGIDSALDVDGKPLKGAEFFDLKSSSAVGDLLSLYRDTGREDHEIEDPISALAKETQHGITWVDYLKTKGRFGDAMTFILNADVRTINGCARFAGADGQLLTGVDLWRAQQASIVWKCVELYEASNQHDAEAEKAILDYAERNERYDLVLQVLERFGRLDEAQRLLDEIPPHMIEEYSPQMYRERLAFLTARRRRSAPAGEVNKEELDRMLALGEITKEEYERLRAMPRE